MVKPIAVSALSTNMVVWKHPFSRIETRTWRNGWPRSGQDAFEIVLEQPVPIDGEEAARDSGFVPKGLRPA